jgi:hypothetical protein
MTGAFSAVAVLFAMTVRLLPLPGHTTIDPFGARSLMAVARDGTIAATATVDGYRTRIVVWNRSGAAWHAPNASGAVVGFDALDRLLIGGPVPERLTGDAAMPEDLSSCEKFPQSSTGPLLAGTLTNGAVIATMQSPAMVDLDDTSGQYAPVALYLRSNQCLNMGNGVVLATGGMYSAGYIAYINNVPAPSNVVSGKERFVAMRWHERTREPLGPGVALAVNADGFAAGADVPPGTGASYDATPRARVWNAAGAAVELSGDSAASVAYGVDASNRVTGMLEDQDRRHYAFVWQDGRLRRLDDVVSAPGWRFECGYAFTPTGGIVGSGTYRGTAAAFDLEGL